MKRLKLIIAAVLVVCLLVPVSCAKPPEPEVMPAPSIEVPPPIPEEVYKETEAKMQELLTRLQTTEIAKPHRWAVGIDSLFVPYIKGLKLSDYWDETTSPGLLIIKHGFHAFCSRRAFNNGLFLLVAKLNTKNNTSQFFGTESGSGSTTMLVALKVRDGQTHFRVGCFGATMLELDIESLLPTDYDTARNSYAIKINRNNALLWINQTLRGIALFGFPENIEFSEGNSPYVLGCVRAPSHAGCLFVGMEGDDYTEWEVYPNGIRAVDGEPITPLNLPLYTENTSTKWNGLSPGAAVTSHPVPVWGYERKTLLFQSDAAGTLDIQVYAGGAWRTWASITLVANQLEVYNLNGEVPIARCIYTPTNADTIAVAEWHLS